ncbi:MAG: NrfD/PsrC family molybdoenzyme membrane anchor subunit [Candidatus Caldarchaeum sp.]
MSDTYSRIENLVRPVKRHSLRFYLIFTSLLAIVVWAAYAWTVQLSTGLGVTGLRTVVWGVYIINFVFFIGISHVGALISAILRLTGSEWRRSVTRMAETVTFASLFVALLMPLIDLGRPDRVLNLIAFGRVQSPLVWDFICIGTYFITSSLYLYVPMIPDIAFLRDTVSNASPWRKRFYSFLSLNWRGTSEQWNVLEKVVKWLTVLIVFMVITVHTVVSWDFAMTLRVGWNSTIFGPYFVAGAVLSGVATVLLIMLLARNVFNLQNFITHKHIDNMAKLLLALDIAVIYFTINEHLVVGYKFLGTKELEGLWLASHFWGAYAPYFWLQVIGGLIIPAFLLAIPATRSWKGYVAAVILINIGMWLERWNIIVPSLALPQLPYPSGTYTPTWVELSITAGAFSLFALIYLSFSKLFPIIPLWETVGHEHDAKRLAATIPALKLIVPQPERLEKPVTAVSKRVLAKAVIWSMTGLAAGLLGGRYLTRLITTLSSGSRVFFAARPLSTLGNVASLEALKELGIRVVSNEPFNRVGTLELADIRYNPQASLMSLVFRDPELPNLPIYQEPVSAIVFIQKTGAPLAPPKTLPASVERVQLRGGTVGLLTRSTNLLKLETYGDGYKVSVLAQASPEKMFEIMGRITEVIMG